ncbi:hypothetical protein [Paenibacillus campinasensis]|uniref:hypothetical protein n=1 Tax=Paenibacillus TaxID=44249 RepID=UPI0012D92586|nr:hypothetical protein [Paenibacillus campinasensis]
MLGLKTIRNEFGVGDLFKGSHCTCGQKMNLELRMLIHQKKTRIYDVPVYVCEHCEHYEVLKPVKPYVVQYIAAIDGSLEHADVSLAEMNESVHVLYSVLQGADQETEAEVFARFKEAFDDRVNMLLDLFGCARKMKDDDWMREIQERLEQLSEFAVLLPENSNFYAR